MMHLKKVKNSPFYQLIFEVDGKKSSISTKEMNIQKAEQFMRFFSAHQQKIQSSVTSQSHSCSFDNFEKEYLEYVKASKSIHYFNSVELSLRRLKSFTNQTLLNKISPRIIDQFITEVYSHSQYAASLYYRTLKAAFSKAVVWEYLEENPLKKIKAPKMQKKIPAFISKLEFNKIINATPVQLHRDVFTFAFFTGMRLSEIINMKWNWINLDKNIITVSNSKEFTTKSKKERIIPIAEILHPFLESNYPKVIDINQNQFVLSRIKGIKLNGNFISRNFKKAVRAANLSDDIHFHTLRHSFASNLAQKGVSLYVIKELLGHESITTTQIYSHLKTENLVEAVNLL